MHALSNITDLLLTLLCAIAAVIIFRFVSKKTMESEHQDYSQLRKEFQKKHQYQKQLKSNEAI